MTDEASKYAKLAEEYDHSGKLYAAIYYYVTSSKKFFRHSSKGRSPRPTCLRSWLNGQVFKSEVQAAELLLAGIKSKEIDPSFVTKAEYYINRAEELKRFGLKYEHHKSEQQLALEKAEFFLKQALNEDEEANVQDAIDLYAQAVELCLMARKNTTNAELQKRLGHLAKRALDRAEDLKKLTPVNRKDNLLLVNQSKISQSFGNLAVEDESKGIENQHVCGSSKYSAEELEVIRITSVINGREYVPFMHVDLRERFAYPVSFSDKHGKLTLSDKQRQRFARWVRPEEIIDQPCIIHCVDSGSIKQTLISDCSFIASLAVSARYEIRFNKKLITNIIYPKHKNGDPAYNPCGKYMIKLHLNGISRKVGSLLSHEIIIDDYLPISQYGELLCSYSQRRNELWVSLLEKAYMKVMGGYDFPGSNSNIDLHALTGWIPDRIAIKSSTTEFDKDKVFDQIFDRYHKGDCLVTIATGQLSQNDQDRSGLVECHAYAMLDVRKLMGRKLFLLKNPWTHLRWKGNYSERDSTNWTEEMQRALSYKPLDAQQFDDERFCGKPRCFRNSAKTTIKDFFAILVDPAPFIDGTRINSPHYLCKMVIGVSEQSSYTLVISQFEKLTTIYYTLREVGEWKGCTAGGCYNNRQTYPRNPIYQLSLDGYSDENVLCIDLKGPKQYSIGFDVVPVNVKSGKAFDRKTSGAYRPGFCILRLDDVPAGTYNIVPTTFLPNQEGPFFLTFRASCSFYVNKVQ
uniref:Calpain catalytic domain-containing protein n=1 Tax=Romanomermis culicivorax TaxID=13658 RepID=A0A915K6Q0_ROMCU